MFWGILALIGGATFVFNGFGVLGDPECNTVSFGGARVVTATCYSDDMGAISGTLAGLGMLVFGAFLIYFGYRTIRR